MCFGHANVRTLETAHRRQRTPWGARNAEACTRLSMTEMSALMVKRTELPAFLMLAPILCGGHVLRQPYRASIHTVGVISFLGSSRGTPSPANRLRLQENPCVRQRIVSAGRPHSAPVQSGSAIRLTGIALASANPALRTENCTGPEISYPAERALPSGGQPERGNRSGLRHSPPSGPVLAPMIAAMPVISATPGDWETWVGLPLFDETPADSVRWPEHDYTRPRHCLTNRPVARGAGRCLAMCQC